MAEAHDTLPEVAGTLARFNARDSADGRFLRYCRGRLRRTPMRLAFSLAGTLAFGVLHDPRLGVGVLVMLLIGEVVDALVLTRICRAAEVRQSLPRRARTLAAASATAQAVATAAAIATVWIAGSEAHTVFFATAFMIGAILDAGVTLGFFRAAATIRLVTYGASLVVLTVVEVLHIDAQGGPTAQDGFDIAASLLLSFMAATTIRYIVMTRDRQIADERTILEEQERLLGSQQALEEKEREAELLAVVARHANDGVVIYNADSTVAWVNETFSRITGYPAAALVGRRIEDIVPADDLDPSAVADLIEARRSMRACRRELNTRRRSGEIIWIEISLTPIPGADGCPARMIAVEREITEAKAREAELAGARARAEDAARAKARFLATMSHELRTPMNGVIGTAEVLADTALDADQRLYVETIVESGRALLAIINDVLDLARIESGVPVIAARPFDPAGCIIRAVALLRPVARSKGLALTVSATEGGAALIGDEGRMRQIVLNLVGNAVKFTEAGSVTVALDLNPAEGAIDLGVSVADTGIGIDTDRLGGIFEPFTQADDDIGRRYGGTGLGLTISQRLAAEMGGRITVSSTVGQGSVFTLRVRLPLAQGLPEPASATWTGAEASLAGPVACRAPSRPRPPGSRDVPLSTGPPRRRVLLVEDNRTNAFIVERMLAPAGVELAIAGDGTGAIEIFRAFTPDIVFMDLSMPGKTGYETAREIRALEGTPVAHCPIVALTAHAFEGVREACLEAGFDGFLTKPVTREALLQELSRLVA